MPYLTTNTLQRCNTNIMTEVFKRHFTVLQLTERRGTINLLVQCGWFHFGMPVIDVLMVLAALFEPELKSSHAKLLGHLRADSSEQGQLRRAQKAENSFNLATVVEIVRVENNKYSRGSVNRSFLRQQLHISGFAFSP